MNQQMQDRRKLTSLRIEVTPFGGSGGDVTFTMVDQHGEALPANVSLREGELANLHDVFSRIAAKTAPAEGGLPFGGFEGVRVILGFEGYTTPNFNFYCTFAYPSPEGVQPETGRARVSDAALARLVAGIGKIKDDGQGAFDWTVAG